MSDTKSCFENRILQLTSALMEDYNHNRAIDRLEPFQQPDKALIESVIEKLLRLIYPGYYRDPSYRIYNVRNSLSVLAEDVAYNLKKQIAIALRAVGYDFTTSETKAEDLTISFLEQLPQIRALCDTDLSIAFDGDPAASGKDEIIIAYPGLFAITVSRLAHVLFALNVPLIPRIMTEYAHGRTGIDIHPGATIGEYFFIDHGTGIVIGETTIIGSHVKIYQGVTIGALSTRAGQQLHGKKRHPTIEDNVTIYAGASILGGNTIIGHDSVIGSNAFITESLAPGTKVSVKNQELSFKGSEWLNPPMGV